MNKLNVYADVIKSSGYRIGPSEIEDCLLRHPAVSLAAVIGVPDPLRGEIVKVRCAFHLSFSSICVPFQRILQSFLVPTTSFFLSSLPHYSPPPPPPLAPSLYLQI